MQLKIQKLPPEKFLDPSDGGEIGSRERKKSSEGVFFRFIRDLTFIDSSFVNHILIIFYT